MAAVDEAKILKLKTHGQNFEILVDTGKALAIKNGMPVDMRDALAMPRIYSDAKKNMEASPNALKTVFNTDDVFEVAKQIIQKAEIPLPTEYREQMRENKKKQIIYFIHTNAVDPQTHVPHPPQRIENALEQVKFHVDEFKDVQKQVEDALKAIRPILPIKFEVKEIEIKIPAQFAAKSHPVLNSFGKKLREDWQNDGSLAVVMEIPGGLEVEFYEKLNALTHGNVESKLLRTR